MNSRGIAIDYGRVGLECCILPFGACICIICWTPLMSTSPAEQTQFTMAQAQSYGARDRKSLRHIHYRMYYDVSNLSYLMGFSKRHSYLIEMTFGTYCSLAGIYTLFSGDDTTARFRSLVSRVAARTVPFACVYPIQKDRQRNLLTSK